MPISKFTSIVTVIAVMGLFATVSKGAVVTTPIAVATDIDHRYSQGGKNGIITTHIRDSVVATGTPAWNTSWQDPVTWATTLMAPVGYQFVVTPPEVFGNPMSLTFDMTWSASWPTSDYTVFFGDSSYAFGGLTGVEPTGNPSSLVSQGLHDVSARATFNVSEPFAFQSITFTTMPDHMLGVFPADTFHLGTSVVVAAITGNGALPDSSLISLEIIPEPGMAGVLVLGLCGLVARRVSM